MLGLTPNFGGHGTRNEEILAWLLAHTSGPPLNPATGSHASCPAPEEIGTAETKCGEPVDAHVDPEAKDQPLVLGQFVCLDDMDLLRSSGASPELLSGHVVKTSMRTGLTRADADAAIAILQDPWPAPSPRVWRTAALSIIAELPSGDTSYLRSNSPASKLTLTPLTLVVRTGEDNATSADEPPAEDDDDDIDLNDIMDMDFFKK